MALRAEHGDAMVSLGTSDTLLLYTDTHAWSIKHDGNSPATDTDKGKQDDGASAAAAAARLSVGYLCHPVDPKGLLMLYCAKNGSLAREQVRELYADSNWDRFDQYLREGMMGDSGGNEKSVGFYFFDREIWPPVQGVYRFESGVAVDEFGGSADDTAKRAANVVAICESQFLAMRIRSSQGETSSASSSSLNPPGISRILATGGASSNRVLLQLLANVFGVPVVSMGTADQQPGAGSAAWGAARKAYLYGRQDATDDTGIGRKDDNDRDSGKRDNESAVAIMPDLEQTKKYADHIPEFLRLEASLL
jgi:xylulokinase